MTGSQPSRAELEAAFGQYVETACRAVIDGDLDPWADLFTVDARYVERILGTYEGREAITKWMIDGLTGFPQNEMVDFPTTWSVVDVERSAVVFACFNQLSDPGDASRHRALVWARLLYAGDGLWAGEENIYNVLDFATMAQGWQHAKDPSVAAPDRVPVAELPQPPVPERAAPAAELRREFARYYEVVADCRARGDWRRFGDLFTEDAVYVDHAVGIVQGREAIVDWMVQTMAFENYDQLERFDVLWDVVDPERGWVVSATANIMSDPGDGSVHQAHDWGRTVYAGNGRWSYKENMYNPNEFADMFSGWVAARGGDSTG
jgi:SnoaL-like domain